MPNDAGWPSQFCESTQQRLHLCWLQRRPVGGYLVIGPSVNTMSGGSHAFIMSRMSLLRTNKDLKQGIGERLHDQKNRPRKRRARFIGIASIHVQPLCFEDDDGKCPNSPAT